MKLQNWLRRKFPIHHKIIKELFDEKTIISYLKYRDYKLAILTNNIFGHEKGKIFLVKKSEHMVENIEDVPFWDGTYDIYGLFTCKKGFTQSGYHHQDVREEDYILVHKNGSNFERKE